MKQIDDLNGRANLFVDLLDRMEQAQPIYSDAIIFKSHDRVDDEKRKELLQIFASSDAVLKQSGLFAELPDKERETIIDNTLPIIWLRYKDAYKAAEKKASPIIRAGLSMMKIFNDAIYTANLTTAYLLIPLDDKSYHID